MGENKKPQFRRDKIITASEIGQYTFCPISWYLQRCGYKPESKLLDKGKLNHLKHGKIMYYTKNNIRKAKILSKIGYIFLIFALILLIFEVVL